MAVAAQTSENGNHYAPHSPSICKKSTCEQWRWDRGNFGFLPRWPLRLCHAIDEYSIFICDFQASEYLVKKIKKLVGEGAHTFCV